MGKVWVGLIVSAERRILTGRLIQRYPMYNCSSEKAHTVFARLLFVFVAAPDNRCTAGIRRVQSGMPEASAARTQSQNQVTRSPHPSLSPSRAEGGTGGLGEERV